MSIKYAKCARPGCMRDVMPNRSIEGLCEKCSETLQIVIWVLQNITKPNEEEKKVEEEIKT